MELVYHSDCTIVAVCGAEPQRCERRILQPEGAELYELPIQRLAEEIGRALGLTVSVEEMPVGRCWSLGVRIDPQAGAESVFLACVVEEEEFDRAVLSLLADGGKDFTLLTPTASDLPAASLQRLQRASCRVRALDNLLVLNDENRLAKVADAAKGRARDDQPVLEKTEAVFRREGNLWRLAFQGASAVVPHLRGMTHLSEILRRPYNSVASKDLVDAGSGGKLKKVSGSELADTKALDSYDEAINHYAGEISKARANNDQAQVDSLQSKLEDVAAYRRKAVGRDGKPRLVGDDGEKARKAVYEAVKRARKSIADAIPELEQHLSQTLDGGKDWFYRPLERVDWQF